jgi:hypothetical protein
MKGDEKCDKIWIFSHHSYVYRKSCSDNQKFKLVLVWFGLTCVCVCVCICVCRRGSPRARDSKNTMSNIFLESMVCAKIHDKG